MRSDVAPRPAPGLGSYADPAFMALEEELEALARSGAAPEILATRLRSVFVERNRCIDATDLRGIHPATLAEDCLIPRRDLARFVVGAWVRHVFLPPLGPRVADGLLVFGLGRLFSSYNDLGVQRCTDADINIVARDGLTAGELASVREGLDRMRRSLLEHFGISLEVDPDYTLMTESEVAARLESGDERGRALNALFYKSNERSIQVLKEHAPLREGIFSRVRHLPDTRLFDAFLGLGSPKPTYLKLSRDLEPLPVGDDAGRGRLLVRTVIGSRAFGLWCRRLFPGGLFVSPPEWHFSMKYFVNRTYDYVGAMRNLGHSSEEIGFDAPDPETGVDPDYRWLREAHKLMLYLQELVEGLIGAYGERCDYSYLSRQRFQRLSELGGDGFRRDFDAMVAEGGILAPSARERYLALRAKVDSKARDRFLEGRAAELRLFPEGFAYELVHKDESRFRICVPYSRADLGFFAFEAIAARLGRIVDERLAPALARMGPGGASARRGAGAGRPRSPRAR